MEINSEVILAAFNKFSEENPKTVEYIPYAMGLTMAAWISRRSGGKLIQTIFKAYGHEIDDKTSRRLAIGVGNLAYITGRSWRLATNSTDKLDSLGRQMQQETRNRK